MTLSTFDAELRTHTRDQRWLRDELETIWDRYFSDTPRVNQVEIQYRRPWKLRLGVISMSCDARTTRIGINSLLSRPDAPYCLTLITVSHELVHYRHGFGSPHPRQHTHPHRGGIVDRELQRRGLTEPLAEYTEWIQRHWWDFYHRHQPPRRRC